LTVAASSSPYYANALKPVVRHTFLHFNTREESADFFPETGVEEFLPPRLVGRRARTPDPIRANPEEEEPPLPPPSHPPAKEKKKKMKKKRPDLGQLPADQKRELAKEVYDTMIKKGFIRPDGYLLKDVHSEIFRGMIGEDSQGRVALHRFSALLCTRKDLFDIFDIGVDVANRRAEVTNKREKARRGEKMVRLLFP
jgi:hypothetical protein